MNKIYALTLKLLEQKKPFALATIIASMGSTPQIPGASALFSPEELLAGTLGGGILEAEAQERAFQALRNKKSVLYDFFLRADILSAEGAICGGDVTLVIDTAPEHHLETFRSLNDSLLRRQAGLFVTLTRKSSGERISLARFWIENRGNYLSACKDQLSPYQKEMNQAFAEKKSTLFTTGDGNDLLFLEPLFPFPRLIIAGAGHIGQAVAHLGSLLDFEVTVIDDRPEFANPERLPDADKIIVEDIGKAMTNYTISDDSYIVIVTRGHRNDTDALRPCIQSKAAYIGMIGSSRKIALMRKNFIEEGWAAPQEFDRIHAPIGLEINSKTVAEIATSIAAELVQVRSKSQIQQGSPKRWRKK
jgi:xanthine dehydrogenase accessory factor